VKAVGEIERQRGDDHDHEDDVAVHAFLMTMPSRM